MGSWMRCLSLEACRVLVLFQLLTSGCIPSLEATVPPSVPRLKSSYNFGKAFLGLDKCNACVGTSICKKFFKEEIRFQNWLSPHLKLPPDYLQSYSGNYTDDAESWRDVEISRLTTKHQHEMSDKKICASLFEGKPCSIEQVLKKTERFQRWMKAKRLTPDLVQIFPGAEGWPFPRYLGSCGRLIVSTSTRPLKAFYSSAPEVAADLAYQLLHIVHSMGSNDLNYFFYFSHIDDDTFGIFSDGRLFIRDSSTLGVIDTQEGYPKENEQLEPKDIFSCLTSNCTSTFAPCDSISEKQNFVVVCNDLLPQLLNGKFPMSVQEKIDRLLNLCKKSSLSDQQVIQAAGKLKEILKSLSTCDSRFAYRYPDCKYSNEY
ncbi:divergent protein kinase domain 2B isoform X2 [Microcaecilia unicolor]|uniref:Divergent protein kinase domain 2B isoform X2 n=1 Tax=Microcaecilia unicolor TaxID=1415580 RepID=A0A6P7XXV5_9AMPH|nr:divergent protein kinase domain 2B isoform X2 [Microcaecilia unicolor]